LKNERKIKINYLCVICKGLTFILFKFNFKTFSVDLTFKYLNFNYFYNFSSCPFSNATIIFIFYFFQVYVGITHAFLTPYLIYFNNKGLVKV